MPLGLEFLRRRDKGFSCVACFRRETSLTSCVRYTPRRMLGEPDPASSPPVGCIRVCFVRHGQAMRNADREACRMRDTVLTLRGVQEAQQLREHRALAPLPRPLLVVVSPLRRALQIATHGLRAWATNTSVGENKSQEVCFVANSDLQECTSYPCDMGTPQAELQQDFPQVDFSALYDAWVEKRPPHHDTRSARLTRFTSWCAQFKVNRLVAVTHGLVCHENLGVCLANGDVVGACLDRVTLQWSPYTYPQSNRKQPSATQPPSVPWRVYECW